MFEVGLSGVWSGQALGSLVSPQALETCQPPSAARICCCREQAAARLASQHHPNQPANQRPRS
eukprot:4296693-Amphidinium_carterae.1